MRRLLLAMFLFSCAHAPPKVTHLREFIGYLPPIPGERAFFAYAELEVHEGAPPRLSAFLLAPDGTRQPFIHALSPEVEQVIDRMSSGSTLFESIPPHLALGLLPQPPEVTSPVSLASPLEGVSLSWREVDDKRYGRTWIVSLEHGGATQELERLYLPRGGRIELVALTPDAAAFRLSSESEAGRISDLVPVDLLAGGRALFVALAAEARRRGSFDEAHSLLLRGEVLGAPDEGELWFERARIAAAQGRGAGAVVEALERAIPHAPNFYRMRARTDEAFLELREESRFLELVHPRPLPGSNRAGRRGR